MSRWDFGDQTLTTLNRSTSGTGDELSGLITQLIDAAEPLAGRFNGSGKAAFDSFKARADQITSELNAGLTNINQGQGGMQQAFLQGNQTMSDDANRNMGAANFDAAKFRTA